jgi:hypothetical protein
MDLLTGQVATVRFQERLAGQGAPLRSFVFIVLIHSLFQDIREKARNTYIVTSGFDAGPTGDAFLKSEGDVAEFCLHDTILVLHGLRVKAPPEEWGQDQARDSRKKVSMR